MPEPDMVKSEMIRQLGKLRETTPEQWERTVFEAFTHHKREDVDWSFEDNQAGYYTWIKSFDNLIQELIEDGYVSVKAEDGGKKTLIATDRDPSIEYSHAVYPPAC